MLSMSNSIRALVNVAMTFFPPNIANSNSDASITLQRAIEQFLQNHITYDQTCAISQKIAGTSQPIERLNKILDTSPEPIPVPDELRNRGFHENRRKTRAWSQYEDQRLLAGIYRNGIENWTSISKFVGNARTRSQCSQRWYRGLDPSICKEPWTKEEEQKLLDLIQANGDKSWTKIASKMGNRSDVQCRYKYRQLQKERVKEENSLSQDQLSNQPDNQGNYEEHSVTQLEGFEKGFNQNPTPAILLTQNIPSNMQPSYFPQQSYISQGSLLSPAGSCNITPSTAQLIQATQQSPAQFIIQTSNSQQSFQRPHSEHTIQEIGNNNINQSKQFSILQQPQQMQIQTQQIHQIQPQQIQIQTQQIQQIQPQQIQIQTQQIQQIQPQQIQIQPQQIQIQHQKIQIQPQHLRIQPQQIQIQPQQIQIQPQQIHIIQGIPSQQIHIIQHVQQQQTHPQNSPIQPPQIHLVQQIQPQQIQQMHN
ncbi:hypothetical protein M9Y10_035351 [Tritrichomonas musculus]|uniref:Myb-like DNA-binding domain containing protein n=1 Tax=Tritrichomonas musculus TaxID=1915356 RepID=A0ABR2KHG6_9EUKA